MIVLDTNVLSEAMRPRPDASVRAWLNAQAVETLYLSSVTLAKLLFGIHVLPDGRRRDLLDESLRRLLQLFGDRILAFDVEAARCFAELAAAARVRGRALPVQDGYIAAVAASRGFAVATRDTAPYEVVGLKVINPWKAADSG
jgi:predicted nucleic acid-binding protein